MKTTFLSRFTPSIMPSEVLESIFVKRQRLVEDAVEQVRESVFSSAKAQMLFVGPRGIGKTHLLSLIYHRLKAMDDIRDRLAVAWLHEDEVGIASFLDLLLAILNALCEDDPALKLRFLAFQEHIYDSPRAEQEVKDLLHEIISDRTLLLMAENLDDLFQGLGDMGQKKLRSFLQETRIVTSVVTSQSLFNGVSRHTSPFYGFFQVEHLTELSDEDARSLLINIAELEDNEELVSFLETPAGFSRIRAVNYLICGNPRLYVIFSELLTRKSLDELVPPFLDLLDNLTPYYQSKMRFLSPQQRKIVEYLSNYGGAMPVKEIGRRTFIAAGTVAAQLKELRHKGYVRSYKLGRESLYEIKEPLMRLCLDVKKQRGEPIKMLVELLRLWYPREELEKQLEALSDDVPFSRDYLLEALRHMERDLWIRSTEDKQGYDDDKALSKSDLTTSSRSSRYWMRKGIQHKKSNNYAKSLESFERALITDSANASLWWWKGLVLRDMKNFEMALVAFDKALEIEQADNNFLQSKGATLVDLDRFDEALSIFEEALSRGNNTATLWWWKGHALSRLSFFERAVDAFDNALAIDPNNSYVWLWKGVTLIDLERSPEALVAFDRALIINSNDALSWLTKGIALNQAGLYSFVPEAFNKAISLLDDDITVASVFLDAIQDLDRWEERLTILNNILPKFAHEHEELVPGTVAIIKKLIEDDNALWSTHIPEILRVYTNNSCGSILGVSVIQTIPMLASSFLNLEGQQRWCDTWKVEAGNLHGFRLVLRLLDAAIRYLNSGPPADKRVLLELPTEERNLLSPLLNIENGALYGTEDDE